MNVRLKILLSKILFPIPLRPFQNYLRIKLIIPCWHLISDDNSEHFYFNSSIKNLRSFIDDLDYFLRHYTPVELDDIINHLNGTKLLKKNSFMPTFDDGFREVHDIIAPALFKKGIKSIFFITTSCVDNKELLYPHKMRLLIRYLNSFTDKKKINEVNCLLLQNQVPGINIVDRLKRISYNKRRLLDRVAEILGLDFSQYLVKKQPYLTTNQIRKLLKEGFEIGSHSIDHPRFQEISLEEQIRQVKESTDWLSNTFNFNCRAFAFPFADDNVSSEFYDIISKITTIRLTMGKWGFLTKNNLKNVPRLLMESDIPKARDLIQYELVRFFFKNYIRISLKHTNFL